MDGGISCSCLRQCLIARLLRRAPRSDCSRRTGGQVRHGEHKVTRRLVRADQSEADAPFGLMIEGRRRQLGGEGVGVGPAGLRRAAAQPQGEGPGPGDPLHRTVRLIEEEVRAQHLVALNQPA